MNFQDTWATDAEGNPFIFTVEMQRQLSQAGLPVDPAYLSQLKQAAPRPSGGNAGGGQSGRWDRDRDRDQDRDRDRDRNFGRDRDYGRSAPPAPAEPARVEFEEPESIQIDPQTGKYIGRMKWYNALRGYGFIARGGGIDIFFHKTNSLVDPEQLSEGQWILYDVEETKKGPEATDVEPYTGELPE